jgi:ubiquitin C-terminal hydrolase
MSINSRKRGSPQLASCPGDGSSESYHLYGVVYHAGKALESGHYFCCAGTEACDWYLFNDSAVSRLSFAEVYTLVLCSCNRNCLVCWEPMTAKVGRSVR